MLYGGLFSDESNPFYFLFCCSFEDSLSQPVDPDMPQPLVAPQLPSDTGASPGDQAQIEAQQTKHAGMHGGVVPKGPPQQSRCKWQLKGSAQVIIALRLDQFCWPFWF